ncbi:MAG: F0F1 ATP synthase subunit delta [Planctomycetaceae bacterium]
MHQLRAREIEAARQQAEQIVTDARKEAERERELSRRRATQMSDLQRDTLAEVTATTAAETVGRLLTQISGPDLQTALIASACQQLQLLPSGRMAPAKVESTQPLTQDQLSIIKAALGSAADTADFKIANDIGNGVRISTAQGLIDASVKGLVQFARQSLVQEMSHRAQDHQPLPSVNDV